MASAVAQAYNGGLEAEPTAGSRGRPPGQGSGGEAPLKLNHFWYLNVQWKLQICPIFYNLEPQRNRIFVYLCYICKKIMGGHETGGAVPPGPGLKPPLVRRLAFLIFFRTKSAESVIPNISPRLLNRDLSCSYADV